MEYALKERIGNPELFTGRKEELAYFLEWIDEIKKKNSRSTALPARLKMGKTALLERLFNITYSKNDGVIPFYYEIKETPIWVGDFCLDFFLTFIYQYIAFKSRKKEYMGLGKKNSLEAAKNDALKEGLDYLITLIDNVDHSFKQGNIGMLWNTVREAPKTVAAGKDEFIVQMIDEFQFMNAKVCRDKGTTQPAKGLSGGYLSTAESKVAPLLVSGSWVGWLMSELMTLLPSRFQYQFPGNMPEDEAVELIYKYSYHFNVPVTDETVYLIAKMTEGSPFYMSAVIRSSLRPKDLTTIDGVIDTLEFETLDDRGTIKSTWMEYINAAFPQINNLNTKNIVIHLCKNRDRELTRAEILKDLKLDMTDQQLEKKLKALVKVDIISQGQTNFDYRGVSDNIFDKVFRGVYEKEIREFDIKTIREEYKRELAAIKKQHNVLMGKYNYQKGLFVEYLLLEQLRLHAYGNNDRLKSITRNLPDDFRFCRYASVWRYDGSPLQSKRYNVDVFARAAEPGDYSIICEVKSREKRKFSKEEAIEFQRKLVELKKAENLHKAIGLVFSRAGFTKEAEGYCRTNGIALSEDEGWLEGKQSA